MLKNISVVLVEPAGDENVGMVARAIKNCAISDLRLVNPAPFQTRGAFKWACNAKEILKKTKVYNHLENAIKDASLVVGLTRRAGKQRPPSAVFEEALLKIHGRSRKGRVAFVFGREDDGLNRPELSLCDMVVSIPSSPSHPSFNLAQAVMLMCHEMFKKSGGRGQKTGVRSQNKKFVSRKEMVPVFKAMRNTLIQLGYDNGDGGELREKIIKRFSELFGRGGLRREDVNMFLGLLARIEKQTK